MNPDRATSSTRTSGAPSVVVRGVDVGYGAELVLRSATFSCFPGTVTALIGRNGSGKSTVLHAIAGLLPTRAGVIEVLGSRPTQVRGRVAYVLQATRVNDQLPVTVREVVAMARFTRRRLVSPFTQQDREAVSGAMSRLELAEVAGRRLDELSGGQRQRVFVAQGLAQAAEVLLLDEPLTGLDPVSRSVIDQVIGEERERGTTVLVTTHNLSEAARYDQMVLLAGRVVAAGVPAEVMVPANLEEAYGTRLLRVDEGRVLLDDPHHDAAEGADPGTGS